MPIRVIPIRAKGSKSPGLRLKPRWGSILRPIANGVFSQPFDLQPSGVRWYGRFRSNYGVGYFSDGQRFAHSTRPRFDAAGSMDTSIADFAALIGAFMQSRLIGQEARRALFSPQAPVRAAHQFPPWSEQRDPELAGVDFSAGPGVVLWTGRQSRGVSGAATIRGSTICSSA